MKHLLAMTGLRPIELRVKELITNYCATKGKVTDESHLLLPKQLVIDADRPKPYEESYHPSMEDTTARDPTKDSLPVIKRKTRAAALEAHQRRWELSNNGRHVYAICPDLRKPTIDCSDLTQTRTQFITSHGKFGEHLFRIQKRNSEHCEDCWAVDTPEHVVYDCRKYDNERKADGIGEEDRPLSRLFETKEQKTKLINKFIDEISEQWHDIGYRDYLQRFRTHRH